MHEQKSPTGSNCEETRINIVTQLPLIYKRCIRGVEVQRLTRDKPKIRYYPCADFFFLDF